MGGGVRVGEFNPVPTVQWCSGDGTVSVEPTALLVIRTVSSVQGLRSVVPLESGRFFSHAFVVIFPGCSASVLQLLCEDLLSGLLWFLF